jgi:hypothetical protein
LPRSGQGGACQKRTGSRHMMRSVSRRPSKRDWQALGFHLELNQSRRERLRQSQGSGHEPRGLIRPRWPCRSGASSAVCPKPGSGTQGQRRVCRPPLLGATNATFTTMAMKRRGAKKSGLTRRRRLARCGSKCFRRRPIRRSYELMQQILRRLARLSRRMPGLSDGAAAAELSAIQNPERTELPTTASPRQPPGQG